MVADYGADAGGMFTHWELYRDYCDGVRNATVATASLSFMVMTGVAGRR